MDFICGCFTAIKKLNPAPICPTHHRHICITTAIMLPLLLLLPLHRGENYNNASNVSCVNSFATAGWLVIHIPTSRRTTIAILSSSVGGLVVSVFVHCPHHKQSVRSSGEHQSNWLVHGWDEILLFKRFPLPLLWRWDISIKIVNELVIMCEY